MNNQEIVKSLNNLIETCRDGKEGFKQAAEGVQRSEWKTFFHENSLQRAKFSGELEQLVRTLGGEPETTGTVAASLHRGWINLRQYLEQSDEKAVLEECERGEDIAVANYKKSLEQDLPSNVRDLVLVQYQEVQKAHNKVRDLRDLLQDPGKAIAPK